MSTQESRWNAAARLSNAANRQFLNDAREALASFDQAQVSDAILAHIKLHARDLIANTEPSIDFYVSVIERAFLTLFDKGALEPVFEITDPLGWDAIDAMRKRTGIGADALHEAPPAVVLTPAQTLERQVLDDWKKLPGDKVRAKAAASRTYRATLDRLLNSDAIDADVKLIQAGE